MASARRLIPLLSLLAFALVIAGAQARPLSSHAASGLVAAYAFEEGSGSTVADLSGNGNNGTLKNATWTSYGKHGRALNFNGVNAFVTVPDSASLDATSALTLEAWVRPTSLGSVWRTAVIKEQSKELAYALYANGSSFGPSGIVYSGAERQAPSPSRLPTGTWTHLAATYDGSSVRLYVNGALAATTAASGPIVTSGQPLRIGGNNVWGEWFEGRIDDVRVYNRALGAAEIAADMTTAVSGTASAAAPAPAAATTTTATTTTSPTTTTTTPTTTTATPTTTTTTTATTTTTPAAPAPSGTASVFLSPSGSDANACTQAAPCQSLARGYAVAAPGATVQLADGYYGCQTISGSKSSVVTFVPATGAVPKIDCQLSISATNLELDSMQIEGIRSTDLQNVTLRNVDVTCQDAAPYELWGGKCSAGLFLFNSVNGFTMIGGSVGPTWDDTYDNAPGQSQIGITLNDCSGCVVKNITLDGVHFHDNRRIDDQQHTSCLMLGGGNTVTIRNSRFTNCAVFDVFATWWNFVSPQYPPGTNWSFENNFFAPAVAGCSGCTAGYFSVEFADYPPTWQNITIRNNSAGQEMNFDGKHSSFAVTGNAMPQFGYSCKSDITYANNTVTGGKCGPTDILVSSLP